MRSGFFNSEIIEYDAEGMPVFDRAEEASFFAKYFSQFISNGVFPNPSTNMQVLATTDMRVKVDIGVCYINGYMGWVETAETLTIEESDTRARIDRIVARLSFTDRDIKLAIKKGEATGNPIAPELQRDYDIYEIGLADIRVNANVVEITQENIIDLRLNAELCGVVANHLQHVDTTTLFNQYQEWLNRVTSEAETDLEKKKQEIETIFNESMQNFSNTFNGLILNCSNNFNKWFENTKITLSGDVAGNLLNLINENIQAIENGKIRTYKIEITTNNTEEIILPCNYKVGANVLDVFLNGEKLILSSDDLGSDGHYREVGEAESISNIIKTTTDWNLEVGDILELIVRRDYSDTE